ncbi:MAG: hypothetical protein EZS28_034559, partial [Streblomastix strix]
MPQYFYDDSNGITLWINTYNIAYVFEFLGTSIPSIVSAHANKRTFATAALSFRINDIYSDLIRWMCSLMRFMLGYACSGSWCVRDGAQLLDPSLLSILTQQVQEIQTAFTKQQTKLMFQTDERAIDGSLILMISFDQYSSNSEKQEIIGNCGNGISKRWQLLMSPLGNINISTIVSESGRFPELPLGLGQISQSMHSQQSSYQIPNSFVSLSKGNNLQLQEVQVPKTFKSLFRTTIIIHPDFSFIAEVSLLSAGFTNASVLARGLSRVIQQCQAFFEGTQVYYDISSMQLKQVVITAEMRLRPIIFTLYDLTLSEHSGILDYTYAITDILKDDE